MSALFLEVPLNRFALGSRGSHLKGRIALISNSEWLALLIEKGKWRVDN